MNKQHLFIGNFKSNSSKYYNLSCYASCFTKAFFLLNAKTIEENQQGKLYKITCQPTGEYKIINFEIYNQIFIKE